MTSRLQDTSGMTVRESLCRFADAARHAPSGDNTQPWRFELDKENSRLVIHVDPERDPSPMNAGQRMARIAVGAAAENVLRTAALSGWDAAYRPSSDGSFVEIDLRGVGFVVKDEIIGQRVTNRRPYDGRPVEQGVLDELSAKTPPLDGVQTHWITDREQIRQYAQLVARADELMFGNSVMLQAFLANVCFDRPAAEQADEGLSLASLEIHGADAVAFRALRRMPAWLPTVLRLGRTIGTKSKALVESSSGLCLLTAGGDDPGMDATVGRALQRAWLALTESDLAAQPMMSMLVLDNLLQYGAADLQQAIQRKGLSALVGEFRTFTAAADHARPAFLLRFGFAPPPSGRTGRRCSL